MINSKTILLFSLVLLLFISSCSTSSNNSNWRRVEEISPVSSEAITPNGFTSSPILDIETLKIIEGIDSQSAKSITKLQEDRKEEIEAGRKKANTQFANAETKLKEAEIETIKSNQSSELDRLRKNKDNEIYNINNQNINKSYIKTKGILSILIGSIIILIPIIYIILIFNKLTHLSNLVKEKWSQVDIFLKQRTDLIPNIVESVKGFTGHEKSTLTNITKARNQVIKATTKEEEIEANKNLSNAINKLLFLQEDYPELKANTNFMNLQENLKEIENNISYARQIYNKAVLKYKNKLEMFPSNIIADIFNFKPELFFTIDSDDRENPNINFNEK